jgi:hypothetical protein
MSQGVTCNSHLKVASRDNKSYHKLFPRLITGILPGFYFGSIAGGIKSKKKVRTKIYFKVWVPATKFPVERTMNLAFGFYPTVGMFVGVYWAWTFWSQRIYSNGLLGMFCNFDRSNDGYSIG